jgi:hypothetical protein
MGDAMVGVADDQLAQLSAGGMPVGKVAGLAQRPAANRGRLVRELDLPVAVPIVLDADEGIGDGGHTLRVSPRRPFVIRDNPLSTGLNAVLTRGGDRGVTSDESAIGCSGTLTVATRGPAGPGEVLVKVRGGTEAFLAWSEQPLAKGTQVLVFNSRGERALDVMEWSAEDLGGEAIP